MNHRQRLEKVALTGNAVGGAIVYRLLYRYHSGELDWEDMLVACVEQLAAVNERLVRDMETMTANTPLGPIHIHLDKPAPDAPANAPERS